MRRRALTALASAAVLAAALALGACGEEEELHVVEGEPVELGELEYNVVISRFLNPDDNEDAAYLQGQPPPGPDELYLGVFAQVSNHGDEPVEVPDDFTVVDIEGNEFEPIESESVFALPLDGEFPADEQTPLPDTPAASGPVQGSMILFLIDQSSTENRPLELEIPSASGEDGVVELDI